MFTVFWKLLKVKLGEVFYGTEWKLPSELLQIDYGDLILENSKGR